jgi:hypothetical protein
MKSIITEKYATYTDDTAPLLNNIARGKYPKERVEEWIKWLDTQDTLGLGKLITVEDLEKRRIVPDKYIVESDEWNDIIEMSYHDYTSLFEDQCVTGGNLKSALRRITGERVTE